MEVCLLKLRYAKNQADKNANLQKKVLKFYFNSSNGSAYLKCYGDK